MDLQLSSPLILILIGVGYLLANMGLIPLTPWQMLLRFWPAIMVYFGAKGLIANGRRHLDDHSASSSDFAISALVLILGLYLLAPRLGWPMFISWRIVWPVLLILLGFLLLFSKDFSPSATNRSSESQTSFIGEIRRGNHSWYLDDMHVWHGVGEVSLDLTQAIIPEREVVLEIRGIVGDVLIFLPGDLPVKVRCQLSLGDIDIMRQCQEDGINRTVNYVSQDYDQATRKVNIDIKWRIGSVRIRRIGEE